jgi:hypothetical protein
MARPRNHSPLAFPAINSDALVFWPPNCPNWLEVQKKHETKFNLLKHDYLGFGMSLLPDPSH